MKNRLGCNECAIVDVLLTSPSQICVLTRAFFGSVRMRFREPLSRGIMRCVIAFSREQHSKRGKAVLYVFGSLVST